MGTAERREREREGLRERIVEAARDIVSEEGLDALSMRALAERIEYSPATIYLYFEDKDALLRSVMEEGFERLRETTLHDIDQAGAGSGALERWAAAGRAYARFALENTAYFRVMFELPTVAHTDCPEPGAHKMEEDSTWRTVAALVEAAIAEGSLPDEEPELMALMGWGLVHGLTSLYLGGQLAPIVSSNEAFTELVGRAVAMMRIREGHPEEETADEPVA